MEALLRKGFRNECTQKTPYYQELGSVCHETGPACYGRGSLVVNRPHDHRPRRGYRYPQRTHRLEPEPESGLVAASTLFIGVAIGVGVGMLFAPVSGEQARKTIRDTAQDVKDKVGNMSGWGTHSSSTASRRSTGTYAE